MKETYYTIKDVSMKTGMSPSTLRYYDKEGLLYFVKRNNAGIRMFKEEDFENIKEVFYEVDAGNKKVLAYHKLHKDVIIETINLPDGRERYLMKSDLTRKNTK